MAAAGNRDRNPGNLVEVAVSLVQTAYELGLFNDEEMENFYTVIDIFDKNELLETIRILRNEIRDADRARGEPGIESPRQDEEDPGLSVFERISEPVEGPGGEFYQAEAREGYQLLSEDIQDIKRNGYEYAGTYYSVNELLTAGLVFPKSVTLNDATIETFYNNLQQAVNRIIQFKSGKPDTYKYEPYEPGYKRGGYVQPKRNSHRVGRMK
jgi:hypothetical protein